MPLYTMVAFTHIPYHQVVERHRRQQQVVNRGLVVAGVSAAIIASIVGLKLLYRALPYRVIIAIKVLDYLV